MTDYLQIYEKFKDSKEVKDYVDDVKNLRYYFQTQQYSLMQEHIHKLTMKYTAEAIVWNTVNRSIPQTYEQAYINAEHFLQVQGALIVSKSIENYTQYVSCEEERFIENMLDLRGHC